MHTTKYKQFPSLLKPVGRAGWLFVSLILVSLTAISIPASAQDGSTTVFLVRHAEKMAEKNDPELSASGKSRAAHLAALLADANISGIFSTDFARTRDTAAPLADALGQEVRLYDPAAPGQLVASLKSSPGRYLVVGHSNTVPDLVERLGGTPGPAIDEKTEYDRLYVLTLGAEDGTTTVLLRY